MLAAVILLGAPAGAQQTANDVRGLLASPATTSLPAGRTRCAEPRIEVSPLRGGLTQIAIDTPCRADQLVTFTYAGVVFIQLLDPQGRAVFVLDCFAGDDESVSISFEDGTTAARRPAVGDDLRNVSKVAIVWSTTIDLDLHAFEYSARFGSPGHVWSGAPRSLDEVRAQGEQDGRGHGFLSTVGPGGEIGMNLEVYTFVHQRGQPAGLVKLAVDYRTRGSKPADGFCGSGHFAELPFKAYIMAPGAPIRRLDLAFAAVPCGTEIGAGARFNQRLIPDLVIRR